MSLNPVEQANYYRQILAPYKELKFDPDCVRKKANVGTIKEANFEKWYLEHPNNLDDPEFVQSLRYASPKLHKLLKTIAYLDAKDQREHGHMFKHFIFSDIKSSTKLLAAGLVASGFRIGVKPVIATRGKHAGKPVGIEMLSTEELAQGNGGKGYFDLMASGSVFGSPMTVIQKKQLFARFNARDDSDAFPRNNHGEQVRIIIMDNGFKEGVDLYDIKYVHIFEPQVTMADTKQVIGRGTRTCGQKGLTFDPERGWPLHVYVYDLDLGKNSKAFANSSSAFDLYLQALGMDLRLVKLNAEMEQMIVEGAVDYELNKAVHDFRGKGDKEADYSWSRTATPEISFHLLESESESNSESDGENNDYLYEAVLPAPDNADAILNRHLGNFFADGEGEYEHAKYKVILDYDMVYVKFKSAKNTKFVANIVQGLGKALKLKQGDYVLELTNTETNERVHIDKSKSVSESKSVSNSKSDSESKSVSESNSNTDDDDDDDDDDDSDKDIKGKMNFILELDDDSSSDSKEIENWLLQHINIDTKELDIYGSEHRFYFNYKTKKPETPAYDEMNKLVKHYNSLGKYTFKLNEEYYYVSKYNWGGAIDIDKQLIEAASQQNAEQNADADGFKGGAINKINFTPTQGFVSNYFTPQNPIKGMLLNHSVGTGKTCTAIATATNSFEPQGYTILWVTRTTLKNDIWKNMFDMVCHHGLMDRTSMPASQKDRMKLLSKSWSVKPISYKQFTNLVTKANSYYARLVKKNGAVDPLRKTLLVIDEAHKLFGGNDLSSIERPDTAKLHQALMSSYEISGDDSVRLLLMTATPITNNPLELVKLLNLCKLPDEQIPDTLGEFADKYLKEDGSFSESGRRRFLDDIAGHISYLNREKDARQFSQPVIHHVKVPYNNKEIIRSLDKHIISRTHDAETKVIKAEVAQKAEAIENHFKNFDKFMVPDSDVCEEIKTPALRKKCYSVVNKKRMALVKSVKELGKSKREQIKGIKGRVQMLTRAKRRKMSSVRDEMNRDVEFYKDVYQKSAYAKLAACGKFDTENKNLSRVIAEQPDVRDLDQRVEHLKTVVPADILALAARIKAERKTLPKDRLKTLRAQLNGMKREHKYKVKQQLKTLKKSRKQMAKAHKRTLSAEKKAVLREEKEFKKEQEALKKLARQEGEVQEIVNEEIKGMVDTYLRELPGDERIQELAEMDREKVAALEAKALAKQQAEEAKAQKAKAALEKKRAAELAKQQKAEAALEKKRAAELAKQQKAEAALEKKAATLKAKEDKKAATLKAKEEKKAAALQAKEAKKTRKNV